MNLSFISIDFGNLWDKVFFWVKPSISFRKIQDETGEWLIDTFGKDSLMDKDERTRRFIEEAIELAQSTGCPKENVLFLVNHVYGRDEDPVEREVGGVVNTLAALCTSYGIDMGECAADEMERCWKRQDLIREKNKKKPL